MPHWMRVRSSSGSVSLTRTAGSTPRRFARSLRPINERRRIDMRRVLASAGIVLFVAARPVAAQELTIDWSRTVVAGGVTLPGEGPDGATALQLRATASGPTSLHLVTIDHPPVTGPAYAIAGVVQIGRAHVC